MNDSRKSSRKPMAPWVFVGFLVVIGLCVYAIYWGFIGLEDRPPSTNESSSRLQEVSASRVLEIARGGPHQAALVNIWATWCDPCVEEFPELLELRERYKSQGLKVILVSADFQSERESVESFLKKQNVTFTTYMKNQKDNEFINALDPDWSGALPLTLLFTKGEDPQVWRGRITVGEVENAIQSALNIEENGGV